MPPRPRARKRDEHQHGAGHLHLTDCDTLRDLSAASAVLLECMKEAGVTMAAMDLGNLAIPLASHLR